MQRSQSQDEFGRLRRILWPVHRHELKKLIPILLIFFCISLDYNILRNLKDALVITAEGSGAEVIPFIKVWVMLPGAVALTWVFTWLSRRLSKEKVFYVVMGLFLLFYATFTFVLYPARDMLHPHQLADQLQVWLPEGARGWISMFRYWTFSAFYAMSELWGNIVLFLLFWAFANEITHVQEAKRFYGLFGLGANMAGIAAGQLSYHLSLMPYRPDLPFGVDAWHQSLICLTTVILISGVVAMLCYRWMNKVVLTDPRYFCPDQALRRKKEKPHISMRESLSYLLKSPYLMGIAAIVLCYNLGINLVEVVWKHEVRAQYPDPGEFNAYMAQVMTWIGIVSTFTALFVSGNAIRLCGWTFTALITPIIVGVTSLGFFGCMFFESWAAWVGPVLFGMTPMALLLFFGSAQNVLCRGAKYTVFDATKELAFVPLSDECKLKGKTIIDGVGTRLGKSGGSVIHQGLLMIFVTLSNSAPYIAAILFLLVLVWAGATLALGRRFNAAVAEKEREAEVAEENRQAAILEEEERRILCAAE